jgi:hypothetical protein
MAIAAKGIDASIGNRLPAEYSGGDAGGQAAPLLPHRINKQG